MAEPKHLWEAQHPYYMTDGCYYAPSRDHHFEFDSWTEFLEEREAVDDDMNLVFRWDWQRHTVTDIWSRGYCEEPSHEECSDIMHVFFVMQRKAFTTSCAVRVTEDDEPAVLKYLTPKARKIAQLWEPIWQGGAA